MNRTPSPSGVFLPCPSCQSRHVIRFGTNATGKARFRCKDCHRAFLDKPHVSRLSDPAFVSQVLAAYHERMSMRGVARVFKISRTTLTTLLKKSEPTA